MPIQRRALFRWVCTTALGLVVGMTAAAAARRYSLALDFAAKNEDCRPLNPRFYFCGTLEQESRLQHWLAEVEQFPSGRETLAAIRNSRHILLVRHSVGALFSAGQTQAPMFRDLTNGVGVDVVVAMHFGIPETGSHEVRDGEDRAISFSALVNFFHELSHARHSMDGNFNYRDPEGQAVADENLFRRDLYEAGLAPLEVRSLRYGGNDRQVWIDPDRAPMQPALREEVASR